MAFKKVHFFVRDKKGLQQILASKIFILVCQKRKHYCIILCFRWCRVRTRCFGFCQTQPQLQVKLSLKAEFALFSINRAWKMTLILREMENKINFKVTGRLPQFVANIRRGLITNKLGLIFEDLPHFIFGWLAR
jgi:hypothetical protein